MLLSQNRILEALRRVHGWLVQHPDVVKDRPAVQRQADGVGTLIDAFTQSATDQELNRVGGLERTSALSVLKRELRVVHMKPIVDLARIVAPNEPEFAADVRLPGLSVTTERLLVSAAAMAKAVEPKKQLFVDHGLPVDFVEQLRATADSVRQTVDARGSARATRAGATLSLSMACKEGVKALQALDTVLRRELRGTAEAREWASIRRIKQPAAAAPVPVTPQQEAVVAPTPVAPQKPATAA